ncbi:MAG: phage tail-like protein [bacterium]|jgi:phage tail-like protein
MSQAKNPYYPVAFYFVIKIAGSDQESSFQEVSGIKSTVETTTLEVGGSDAKYPVPTNVTYSDLVLKRGLASTRSPLVKWCQTTVETPFNQLIQTKDIEVQLLNPQGKPARSWNFRRAYPIVWEVDTFNAMENKLAIETITFKHFGFTRTL